MSLDRGVRAVVAGLLCLAASGCCAMQARFRTPSLDYFERYVIVDVGPVRDCCVLPKRRTTAGREIRAGQPVRVWVRSVFATSVRDGASLGPVRLSVVTSFGDPETRVEVLPATLQIGPDGYAIGDVFVNAKSAPLHFRIRAEFSDKQTTGISYSPFILVR